LKIKIISKKVIKVAIVLKLEFQTDDNYVLHKSAAYSNSVAGRVRMKRTEMSSSISGEGSCVASNAMVTL